MTEVAEKAQFFAEAHPDISIMDLARLEDIKVIHEGAFKDSDGVVGHIYTLAGYLDGRPIELIDHQRKCILGATVGGDVIIVHGKSRSECDAMAIEGLMDTIKWVRIEASMRAMEGEDLEDQPNAGIITTSEVRGKTSEG